MNRNSHINIIYSRIKPRAFSLFIFDKTSPNFVMPSVLRRFISKLKIIKLCNFDKPSSNLAIPSLTFGFIII